MPVPVPVHETAAADCPREGFCMTSLRGSPSHGTQLALRMACSLLVACGFLCRVACGDATPAACFGSHMVLQRDMPLPVWEIGRAHV